MRPTGQYGKERTIGDSRFDAKLDFAVRSIADQKTGPKVLVDDLYFDGLDFLRCHVGRFRFSFRDRTPVEIGAGEVLVLYPGRYVTIEALERNNRLVYGTFVGPDVESYFEALGFFDLAHGKTAAHLGSIEELRRLVEQEATRPKGKRTASWKSALTDILSSQAEELRVSYPALVFDALRVIRAHLREGVVRIEPLCEELGVSRVYLNRVFVAAGLGSPSEVIRAQQIALAVRLLTTTSLEIAEVARRTGFLSPAHFSTLVRQKTGQTPSALRRRRR